VRRERQLLIDHGHAGAARIERVARSVGTAFQQHPAGIRSEGAGEDGHERALAGAVLSDERADFAIGHREIDSIDSDRGGERLPDAAHLESRRAYFSHFDRSGVSSSFTSG
jgi:hypothetical protein